MGTTVTTNLGALVSSRRKELVLLSLILVALFVLVAMVGWQPSDPSLWRGGSGTVDNPCGWIGANVADGMFALLGWGAWVLVPLVGLAVVGLAGRRVLDAVQVVSSSFIFLFTLGGLELALRPGVPHGPGGVVGWGVATGLETVVGTVGAWIVLGGATLLLFTWSARIPWSSVASRVVGWFERFLPVVAGWVKVAAAAVWGALRVALAWLWRQVLTLFRAAGAGVGAGAMGAWGLFGRMAASVLRSDDSDEDEEEDPDLWDDDEVASSVWEDSVISDVNLTDPEDVTRVGGERALVEAEWEETFAAPGTAQSEVLDLFPALAPRSTGVSEPDVTPLAAAPRSQVPPADVEHTREKVAATFEATGRGTAVPREGRLRPARTSPRPSFAREHQPEPSIAPPSMPAEVPVPAAPAPTPAPAPAPVAEAHNATSGPGVDVRHNELLEIRVADDGQALRKEQDWELPRLNLLDRVPDQHASYDEAELRRLATVLEEKLASFKVEGRVTGVLPGPVVTIFEFLPNAGVKVSKISGLSDDLAMALKALRVRIVAPIPGRGVVGIEIPSKRRLTVFLREVLAHDAFRKTDMALPCVLGKDVEGHPVVSDLARMPHLLVGGTTGSGKSVGVNGMLMSMLFTRSPEELRLMLIDPKMLEFEMYSDIPHLLHPVVTEAKIASQALAWACREMDERYALLARWGTRNIVSYNKKVERELADWSRQKAHRYAPKGWSEGDGELPTPAKLPYIVIVIDELADLMMVAGKEVEESICRLAQKARACGIHLIVATQRPSVDVVTGLIKANLPTRIAFTLRSRHDSRTVLDAIGAENLLGKGDMLFQPPGSTGLKRCHGAFVSDEEVGRVTSFLRDQGSPEFIDDLEEVSEMEAMFDAEEQDELYDAACQVVVQAGKASTSMLQRHLKIGYNRAARIVDAMEAAGLIGPADGARPREVLVSQ